MAARTHIQPWPARTTQVALIGALILIMTIALSGDRVTSSNQATATYDSRTLLLVSSRNRLALCLDASNDGQILDSIENGLVLATGHDQWNAAGLGPEAPIIKQSCPTSAYLLDPEVKAETASGKSSGPFRQIAQEAPSKNRLFIFVFTQHEMAEIFGPNVAFGFAPQEALCTGGVCTEVSTGLYLDASVLARTDLVATAIQQAVGLEPRFAELKQEAPTRWPLPLA